jgi:chromosome segregation ATPase
MTRNADLEKAEREVKDTEQKLHKIKSTLKDVEDEIAKLTLLEAQLNENINYLKQSGATVMATEFKKAKEDLVRTRGRLSVIKIDRDSIARAQRDGEAYLEKAKEAMAKALLGKDNVLSFKKRKKDGG